MQNKDDKSAIARFAHNNILWFSNPNEPNAGKIDTAEAVLTFELCNAVTSD